MPRIFTAAQLSSSAFPSVADLRQGASAIEKSLRALHHTGDIVSASAFGSFYAGGTVTAASDLDWLIIFTNLERMTTSVGFANLITELSQLNINFSTPMLPLECLSLSNHMLAPILHGVGQSRTRCIIGQDPLDVFLAHGIRKNNPMMVDRMFASFTRYFFEDLVLLGNPNRLSDIALASLLQRAVNHFLDTVRTMIVVRVPDDDFSAVLSFETYTEQYRAILPEEVLNHGSVVQAFIRKYVAYIADATERYSAVRPVDLADDYTRFLRDNLLAVRSAAAFIIGNVNALAGGRMGS